MWPLCLMPLSIPFDSLLFVFLSSLFFSSSSPLSLPLILTSFFFFFVYSKIAGVFFSIKYFIMYSKWTHNVFTMRYCIRYSLASRAGAEVEFFSVGVFVWLLWLLIVMWWAWELLIRLGVFWKEEAEICRFLRFWVNLFFDVYSFSFWYLINFLANFWIVKEWF